MKLFQIEEPDGSLTEPDAPGAAVGIDASGGAVTVAAAVGGNAVLLEDRAEFPLLLRVPTSDADDAGWRALFEGARLRAERSLSRPVTHAVVAMAMAPEEASHSWLRDAAAEAGLSLLRVIAAGQAGGQAPVIAAALLAEDLAPRSGTP